MNAITTIKIEKGIPLPLLSRAGKGRPALYPFDQMEVGDSFSVPDDRGITEKGHNRVQNSLTSCINAFKKNRNPNAKFTARVIKDEGVVRVWRVA